MIDIKPARIASPADKAAYSGEPTAANGATVAADMVAMAALGTDICEKQLTIFSLQYVPFICKAVNRERCKHHRAQENSVRGSLPA